MRRVFVDTGYVLALVDDTDQNHERALKLSRKYQKSLFMTTQAIILELGNFLARNYKQTAVELIEEMYDTDNFIILDISSYLFEESFNMYKTYQDKTWGLVDCISFVVMREEKIKQAYF